MIPESYRKLIKTLIKKNELGNSLWNETSVKDQYKLILNNGMIVLTCKEGAFDNKVIYLDIYDNTGVLVGSFSAEPILNKSDFDLLNELHNSICHLKELKINKQISILIDEINTSDKIGKKD